MEKLTGIANRTSIQAVKSGDETPMLTGSTFFFRIYFNISDRVEYGRFRIEITEPTSG